MRTELIKKSFILLLIFFIVSISNIEAQESCTQNLKKAQEYFKNGKNELVAPLLEPCLANKSFSKEEKVIAYRLLAMSYLYAAEDSSSVENMRKLLKTKPEYEISLVEDPAEFISLYETFKTNPVTILGVKVGAGLDNLHSITYFDDIDGYNSPITYKPEYIFTAGMHAEIPLVSFISIDMGINYNLIKYSYSRNFFDFSTLNYSESVTMLGAPLLLQFNLMKRTKTETYMVEGEQKQREVKRKFIPYVNMGVRLGLNINSKVSDISKEDKKDGEETRELITSTGIDVTDTRNFFNYALAAGVGFRLKDFIGNGYLTFDIRYSYFMNNLVDRENRFPSDELVYDYYHTDNEFKFEDISVLIGYSLPLYSAKQYKRFRKQ